MNSISDVITEVRIVAIECGVCGIQFGIGQKFHEHLVASHDWFFCPRGCRIHYYDKTEAEKLKEQLDNARQRARNAEAREQSWRDQAETAEARRRAEKGAKTKLQKRIAAGVCPCCRRSFVDLQRHIAGQHPNYPTEG